MRPCTPAPASNQVRRHDDRVDERPLDAMEHRRLVTLVDDAHRHEQHARAEVERRLQQDVDVGLLELQLAGVFQPLDERVFDLELTDEAQAVREAVAEQQDEAVEVERSASPSARSSGALRCISM